ncbi:hypothetical protein [Stenotrophomonas indicatrix]|uniref:hypothetical protein n=1 Tax=Stenotrophomonas indicatrix TaxID=2045451 RepID=UPI0028AA0A04|nr:hypothetical protein [Stenotrophomonas indicatrix]
MNKYVQDAAASICELDQSDPLMLGRRAENLANALELSATGDLKSFTIRLVPSPKPGMFTSELLPIGTDVPREMVELANCAWRWCGGNRNHERGVGIVAASRIEFARATLASLLWELGSSDEVGDGRPRIEAAIASADWEHADDVARTLWAETLPEESSGSRFMGWCEHWDFSADQPAYNTRSPSREVHDLSTSELGAGIALTWIDEALASQCRGLAFLAEAAQALHDAGLQAGFIGHKEMLETEGQPIDARNREFARKGSDAAHRRSREAKGLVLATYRSGTYPSKDKAAEEMAGKLVHYAFRTVRDWLKDA